MKQLSKDIANIFKEMNKISKKILLYGSIPIFFIGLACLILYICAGRFFDYYGTTQLLFELLHLEKEMIGVIVVPALLVEIIDMATGKKRTEQEAEEKNK